MNLVAGGKLPSHPPVPGSLSRDPTPMETQSKLPLCQPVLPLSFYSTTNRNSRIAMYATDGRAAAVLTAVHTSTPRTCNRFPLRDLL